jgi:hypothetical protein
VPEGRYAKIAAYTGVIIALTSIAGIIIAFKTLDPHSPSASVERSPAHSQPVQAVGTATHTPSPTAHAKSATSANSSGSGLPVGYQGAWGGYVKFSIAGSQSDRIDLTLHSGYPADEIGSGANLTLQCQAQIYYMSGRGPIFLQWTLIGSSGSCATNSLTTITLRSPDSLKIVFNNADGVSIGSGILSRRP